MKNILFILLLLVGFSWVPSKLPAAAADSNPPQLQLQNGPQLQPPQSHEDIGDIADIRAPVLIDDKQNRYTIYGLVGAGLLLLMLLLIFIMKRKKALPSLPDPGEIALSELKEARSLMDQGKPLSYAERVSTIVRHYIEKRFQILSTRQTTSEFLHCLTATTDDASNVLNQHKESLQHCLEKCDMAKFAHNTPGNGGMEEIEESLRHFITTTSPLATPQGKE